MSSNCVPGLCSHPISKDGRARWFAPETKQPSSETLKIKNSITDSIDEFIPLQNRTVRWYVCGPTVYDDCHMGHARAYLTFDILRRIMQDYLNYNVIYQVNITDVDDKIILRARQNKLIELYILETKNTDYEIVKSYADIAMKNLRVKLETKMAELQQPLPDTTTSRDRAAQQENIEGQKLKLKQMAELEENVQKSEKTVPALIAASREALAEQLDKERGHTIIDQQIFEDHARKFEHSFHQDMQALGVREPDVVTRVTEFVPQIVKYIETIIKNGYGYESNGSVYFDTNTFKNDGFDYRKLNPGGKTTKEEMAEGEGALANSDSEKKHPNDFALWKASKPGEPQWESPWGAGRPGWHIECSVMASDIFGQNLDIHGGGIDLMFPHHDNEMAQAEAYHKCNQWVNYFLHAGKLEIETDEGVKVKMSKSLKNFVKIHQALEEHSPRQLRMMFLMQPWDKSMNYSDKKVDEAKSKEKYFKNFFGAVKSVLRNDFVVERQGWTDADKKLSDRLVQAQEKVHASLLDNFKTYEAVTQLYNLVGETNQHMSSEAKPKNLLVKKIAIYVTKMLRVFGLVEGCDEIGFGDSSAAGRSKEAVVGPFVSAFVEFRDKIRSAAKAHSGPAELLRHCDNVRNTTLAELGIRVEDSADSSVWKMDDPEVVRKEIEEKRVRAAEAAAKKQVNKIKRLEDELAKARAASVPPSEMFKVGEHADKWGSYDETGMPTTTKDGEPLNTSQRKKLPKDVKRQEVAHDKVVKAAGDLEMAAYLASLEDAISQLKLDGDF